MEVESVDNSNNDSNNKEETLTKQQKKNKKKREAAKKKKNESKKEETAADPVNNVTVPSEVQAETDHFEEELCWCISQLELGLKTQKPARDQAAKNTKLLNQLKSQKTPKPKKRMLMRTTFGNYREKMAKELKTYQQVEAKLVEVDESIMKKSTYLKKRVHDLPETTIPQTEFRFDFPDPT